VPGVPKRVEQRTECMMCIYRKVGKNSRMLQFAKIKKNKVC